MINFPKSPFPKDKCLQHLFEESALKNAKEIALAHNGKTLTYTELNEKANRLAQHLIKLGVKPDSLVGISLERSFDLMISVLGILKAGAAYVPFDPEYPKERLAYMMETAKLPVMVTQESLVSGLPKGNTQQVVIDREWKEIEKLSAKNPEEKSDQSHLAYVLFTSGSTGNPKGVAMPHRPLVNLITWQKKNSVSATGTKTLQFAPISFDVSFQEIFSTWCTGGSLVLIDDDLRLNAVNLLNFINENKIERLFLPFIALQHLSEVAKGNEKLLVSLKEIITAGEQLQITPFVKNLFEKIPHCALYNHYGPTEGHVVTSFKLTGKPSSWEILPSIGTPIDNSEIYILDENMKWAEEGELYIGGVSLARGYLNRDDLTAERFVRNPFSKDKAARLYKTGDLAKILPGGNIQYLGRIDGQVKVRGYRIELGEIEVALQENPSVNQCALTVREDVPGEKKLVAYVVLKEGQPFNISDLRKFLAARLPDYMMPSAFVKMDSLPRTPSGKIDRRSLPKPDTSRPEIGILYVAPRNETEKMISNLWAQLLGIDKAGVNDNFFDLGGNSLLALKAIAKLRQEKNLDVPVVKMYQHPTAAGIASFLDNSSGTEKSLADWAKNRKSSKAMVSEKAMPAGRQEKDVTCGIAVIGMALRFPGADSTEQFWKNLSEGKESVTFFSKHEIDASVDRAIVNDPSYVAARGIINDADKFDAAFFGMNPKVAEVTDPQHRVFLELAWSALEDAGYSAKRYKGMIGVFAGTGNNSYFPENVFPNKDAINRVGQFLVMTSNEKDYIATRTAFEMDLTGPALSIHTACSTSLVAIVEAYHSLMNHHCDMAMAGGVSITSPIKSGHLYQEGSMLSGDGHCRPFDAKATGTTFGDGAGIIILKRYKDAVADGDTIHAVIRGGALNNDGSAKASFTAPSVEGQAKVISMAMAEAGVEPSTISYIETHGTATPLGDPIEIEGLTLAFSGSTDKKQFCAIGSVKSNFGHLTSAAGVAGVIKTILALKNKKIPPSLFFEKPNPAIDFSNSPFHVANELTDWKTDGNFPRRAGISSFGVGGTNAHIIIEEAPKQETSGIARPKHVFFLSAKTSSALDAATKNFESFLKNNPDVNLADAAFTFHTGRKYFNHRKIFAGGSIEEILQTLQTGSPANLKSRVLERGEPQIAFMFPGQGAQYVNMGKSLYRDEIVFKEAVDTCCEILSKHLGIDLKTILYPAHNDTSTAEKSLKETFYTQPALFTLGYALSKLWNSWGIKQSGMIGHSIGEFVAACLSGVMSLEDALFLVANRGKLMQDLPHGSMLSVRAPAAEIEKRLSKELSIAAINGPSLCVVSGSTLLVEEFQKLLEKEEIVCKPLHTSHAFHSPMMDPIIEPFAEKVRSIKLSPPRIPFVSTVTAQWITDEQATDVMYWAKHLRLPVRFAEGIQTLWKENPEWILLECGPRTTAATLARQQASDMKKQVAVSSLGDTIENEAEWQSMMMAIGQLWLCGAEFDWDNFYALEKRQRISLPGYPFERQRYWLEPIQVANLFNPINLNNSQSQSSVPSPQSFEKDSSQKISAMNIPRRQHLVSALKEILEDSSGMDLKQVGENVSFIEMGLDSLFLTQTALTLSKKYGVKITFRQLNETLSSFGTLADYLDKNLPADTMPVQQQFASPVAQSAQFTQTPSGNPMETLIIQQMQMLQVQLQMLRGSHPVAPSPQSPVPSSQFPVPSTEDEAAEKAKPFGAIARIEKTQHDSLSPEQQKWIEGFIKRYNEKTKKSKSYTQQHRSHLADPRVVTGFKPAIKELIYQVVVNRSQGTKLWDIDGNEYTDVLNGFGSNFLGYGSPIVMKAVEEQLKMGIEIGPQHPLAGEITKMICEFTGFDRAALCNTGSEAVLGVMRMARTVTGRNLIVMFNGSYHGINDEVIVRGTKKLKSFPAAAGIPPGSVESTLILDYGTPESLEIIRSRASELAAVMVEPIQSRRADFRPKEFLHELRKITEQSGTALIFDEVITGFRLLPGGAQEYFGVKSDLGSFGKVIGGGMPIGVMAGKKEYMDALDGGQWQFGDGSVPEAGVTYFAGTFVRHPLALAATKAVLDHLKEKGRPLWDDLNAKTKRLVDEINDHCKKLAVPFHLVSFGSLFKAKWDADVPFGELIFLLLRYKGVHIYDGFPCFLTTAFTDADVDFVIKSYCETIDELFEAGFLPSSRKPVSMNGNGSSNGVPEFKEFDPAKPPVPGARVGKDPNGNPGWFIPDPDRPGKYLQVK